jgi:hypothetical protein
MTMLKRGSLDRLAFIFAALISNRLCSCLHNSRSLNPLGRVQKLLRRQRQALSWGTLVLKKFSETNILAKLVLNE